MIADQIFAWAATQPARIAFRYDDHEMSYGDFAEWILRTRARLESLGCIGPGVALILTHHIADCWVISLALRSLGLTTLVPPSGETILALPLSDVRCAVSIGQTAPHGLEEACRSKGYPIARVDDLPDRGVVSAVPDRAPGGHILLTSGTTGRHKMLLMDAASEDAYHAVRRAVLGIDENTVFHLFNCGLWTGVGYKTPAAVWAVGGAVIIRQAEPLHAALSIRGTHAVVVPSTLAEILAAPEGAFPHHKHMQLSLTGGRTSHEQVEQARRRISANLYNRLSSTEASIFGFTRLETLEDEKWHQPLPDRIVQIVDAEDRLVPTGVPGYLRVSTKGGPSRYLDDPEATAACFRDGFFYPGDLAVARADGRFALQGRATEIINVNGHKVSATRIEEQLQEELGLSAVCLFSVVTDAGPEELHLAVEGSLETVDADLNSAFESACRSAGIYGNIEASVLALDEFPRTPTGKIIRHLVKQQLGIANGGLGAPRRNDAL